jgi:hypothetical protein
VYISVLTLVTLIHKVTKQQFNTKLNDVDSTTCERTIQHKLSIINKTIEQLVPTEESRLHMMHEYLLSSAGQKVIAYHEQQQLLHNPGKTISSMYLYVYMIIHKFISV